MLIYLYIVSDRV